MLSGKNENGINYYTARKLKDMAQSLEQLAKAFDEGAGETMSLTKDDGLAAMQTCAALVCGNCGGCSLYADSEKEDIKQGYPQLASPVEGTLPFDYAPHDARGLQFGRVESVGAGY